MHVSEPVQQYAVALATATRRSPDLRLGASPRATLHLVRAAKAWAAMQGREYVLPDDVRDLAPQVLPAPAAADDGGHDERSAYHRGGGAGAGPGAGARRAGPAGP